MEKGFVKAGLILVCNDKDIISIASECFSEFLICGESLSIFVNIQTCFCVVLSIYINRSGKRNKNVTTLTFVRMLAHVLFNSKIIPYSVCSAICNDHSLAFAANLKSTVMKEICHNHIGFFGDCVSVFLVVFYQNFECWAFYQFGIVCGNTNKLESFLDSGIICENVKNVSFLDGLSH